MQPIRNRIKAHRRVRAGELLTHEFNFRTHPEPQRAALAALYQEVGFARSLLAYELPNGQLKLLDGHLRRDLAPDMEVDVEVLDVNEDEARALLLSIDPLAALAETQEQLHQRLLELAPPVAEDLKAAWEATVQSHLAALEENSPKSAEVVEQYLVLVTCRDEQQQLELLELFHKQGLVCKALLS